MELLPACSSFNSEQNNLMFRYTERIFVVYSIPDRNVILTGKIVQGQTGPMALNYLKAGKEALQTTLCEK